MLANAIREHQAGRLDQAKQLYLKILAIDVRHADALHMLGILEYQERHYENAAKMIQRAIAVNSKNAGYHSNLGLALQALGKLDEAADEYRHALDLNPSQFETLNNLSNILFGDGKLEDAKTYLEQALALNPNYVPALTNLGPILQDQGNLEDAKTYLERALTLNPDYPEALSNLGSVLQDQGKVTEALALFERAIAIKPDYADAQANWSLIQLLLGNFADGWSNYEWRWLSRDPQSPWHAYTQPRWNGGKIAEGHVMLWGEQGVGDEIMFAGLLPDAIRTGNHIKLVCDSRLKPLFARSFTSIEVLSRQETGAGPSSIRLPCSVNTNEHPQQSIAYLPLGSLPGIFRTSEEAFSATTSPYLKADPVERERLRSSYDDGRRLIGLAWHTSNQKTGRRRSISLEMLAPLFALGGFHWISLQYGDFDALEQQAAAAGAPLAVDRTVNQLANMDLFAAQVSAMDLVITIDNSTAHLAGALGVPVWTLLPYAPDWRWMLDREDSPWYPTMRLFRQPEPGDWQPVLARIHAELATLACGSQAVIEPTFNRREVCSGAVRGDQSAL